MTCSPPAALQGLRLTSSNKSEALSVQHFLSSNWNFFMDAESFPRTCLPTRWSNTSVLSSKYEVFCCDQNGPPARRSEPDWRMEGAYLKRYVTDEQRSRRPIFIATLWAGASWLFFRVARSTRMTKIWALRSRLEKQPTDLRQNTSYCGDRTLEGTSADWAVLGVSREVLQGALADTDAHL